MLKKIIISLMTSMMIIFIIWVAIGYKQYGNDLIHHHINLRYMFSRFKSTFVSYNILDDLKNIKFLTATFSKNSLGGKVANIIATQNGINLALDTNNVWTFLLQALTILISPISSILFGLTLFIYITGSATMILVSIVDLIIICLEFVFVPQFV